MENLSDYGGIDYSLGQSNRDPENGIAYGVISQHSISGEALSEINPVYPDPEEACPKCGDTNLFFDGDNENGRICNGCNHAFVVSDDYVDLDPIGLEYEDKEYLISDCLDFDLFVLKSPYYTWAQFCSPCVPGAGNLDTPTQAGVGVKCYCLGHDWFENGKAPYPIFEINSGKEV